MNPRTIFKLYECTNPPPILWRVTEKISQAQRDAEYRLTAPNNFLPITRQELKEAIKNHLNWADRSKASCFLSVFSDKINARNWALDLLEDLEQTYKFDEEDIQLVRLKIDSAKLIKHTWIFDAQEIVNTLELDVKIVPGEYLVYSDIPSRTIVSCSGLAELRLESGECKQDRG
jgi:hypothetical protein